jgi:Alg9-like mannosyltransferase family
MAEVRAFVAVVLDCLIVATVFVIVTVLVTGGGVYDLRGIHLSLRSADNPLTILALLLLLRYFVRNWAPLFGIPRWNTGRVLSAATHGVQRADGWAVHLSANDGARLVLVIAVLAFALKAWLASTNPGFYSGDDVEIDEMTLGRLLHHQWPIWDLRNAIFPMGVVFPAQWTAFQLGVRDVGTFVIAGRLIVAALSTISIWLAWRIARDWSGQEPGYAVLAALLLATTKLQVAFGSSELPRPVSTVLVLFAFHLLQQRRPSGVALSGACLGAAASLRFSEAVFGVPAVVQLLIERRIRDGMLLAVVACFTAATMIGVSDQWYWGEPFRSVRTSVDYTLVRGFSSRGYQSPWWYLTAIPQWINVVVGVFAGFGWRSSSRSALWAVLPLVLLSCLPHKEPRYLIPITPFVCLTAAAGVRRCVSTIRYQPAAPWLAATVVGALVWGLAQDATHYRLPRSNVDVAFARRVLQERPPALVAEQAWRLGGHLYCGSIPLTDLNPELMSDRHYVERWFAPAAWVFIDTRSLAHQSVRDVLSARGYRDVTATFAPAQLRRSGYTVWRP